MTTPPRTLLDLAPGVDARVIGLDVVDATLLRLMEMGLVPGTDVRIRRRAPFGCPIELEVRGTRLCLRRSESARIRVQLVDDVRAHAGLR